MVNVEKQIKQLYKDAMYVHLIRNGYSNRQAKTQIKNFFAN